MTKRSFLEANVKTTTFAALLCLFFGLIAACETTIEPGTGRTTTQWNLPLTAANEQAFQERWRSCIQFASESVCEQRFGGRRPQRIGPSAPIPDYDNREDSFP